MTNARRAYEVITDVYSDGGGDAEARAALAVAGIRMTEADWYELDDIMTADVEAFCDKLDSFDFSTVDNLEDLFEAPPTNVTAILR